MHVSPKARRCTSPDGGRGASLRALLRPQLQPGLQRGQMRAQAGGDLHRASFLLRPKNTPTRFCSGATCMVMTISRCGRPRGRNHVPCLAAPSFPQDDARRGPPRTNGGRIRRGARPWRRLRSCVEVSSLPSAPVVRSRRHIASAGRVGDFLLRERPPGTEGGQLSAASPACPGSSAAACGGSPAETS